MLRNALFRFICSLSLLAFSLIAQAANTVVDVLVVYTPGVTSAYGGDPTTRINQIFQVTNQIYKDSNLPLEIRIAKTIQVNYTDDNSAETALNDITNNSHSAFSNISLLRDQFKADMVVFYRPYKSVHGSCGLAWIGGNGTNGDFSNPAWKKYMYAHVAINTCGDYVTAHELGHNMGLKHSRKQDGTGGTFGYALGYGLLNQFTTIMAYQSVFNVDYWSGKMYKFSSPALTCKGVPCGVDKTDSTNGADAVYALSVTTPQIARFYNAISSSSVSSSVSTSSKSSSSSLVSSSLKSSSVAATSVKSVSSSSKFSAKSASSAVAVGSSKSSSSTATAKVSWTTVPNVAQYGGVDWSNEVQRKKGMTLEQAKALAAANPNITYFFYTKGAAMYLSGKGLFVKGDAVFFSGKPWYGSAIGLADSYQKLQ